MFSVFLSQYTCIFNYVKIFLIITETVLKLIPMSEAKIIISVKNWLRHATKRYENRYNILKDVLLLLLFKILILLYIYFLIINFHTNAILSKAHIY